MKVNKVIGKKNLRFVALRCDRRCGVCARPCCHTYYPSTEPADLAKNKAIFSRHVCRRARCWTADGRKAAVR